MQVTGGAKRVPVGLSGFGIVTAAGILVCLVIVAWTLVITDPFQVGDGGASTVGLPKAYTGELQGEGLVGSNRAIVAAPKAYYAVNMGEGRLNLGGQAMAAPKVHYALGMGEGIRAGIVGREVLETPVKAYYSAGMGEGWQVLGRPDETTVVDLPRRLADRG